MTKNAEQSCVSGGQSNCPAGGIVDKKRVGRRRIRYPQQAPAPGGSHQRRPTRAPRARQRPAALEQVSTGSDGFDSAADVPEFTGRAVQISTSARHHSVDGRVPAASNQRVSKLWLAMDVQEIFSGLWT